MSLTLKEGLFFGPSIFSRPQFFEASPGGNLGEDRERPYNDLY